MAERRQEYARTVLSTPVQSSGAAPARTAAADLSGFNEFGRALSATGEAGMRTADQMEDNKLRIAHNADIQRKNMLRQTQEGLDVSLKVAVFDVQRTDPNWALGDEKYRAQKLEPIVKQWQQTAQQQAKDAGIQIPSSWLAETTVKYTLPELEQGLSIGSANNIAARNNSSKEQINSSINLASDGAALLKTMPQVHGYLTGMDDTYLGRKDREQLYTNARTTAAERAVGLASRGLISEAEIEHGLQKQYWDNSQAEAMRAKLGEAGKVAEGAIKSNYDQMLAAAETDGRSFESIAASPEAQAMAKLAVKRSGGDLRVAHAQLDAMGRGAALASVVGSYQVDLVNNRGTPDAAPLWDKVASTIAQMSDPETARQVFTKAIEDRNLGVFTDAEVAPAADKILKSLGAWKRDIEQGRANIAFSNDISVVDYARDNPTWNTDWTGRHRMMERMENAQRAAGVPDQYVNAVHPGITAMVATWADKPAEMRQGFKDLAGPQGLGSDTPKLIRALAADTNLMAKRPELVGVMSEIALYAQLAPGDPRREGMEQTLDLAARTIDFVNKGGVENLQKQYPEVKKDASRALLMMTGSVANDRAQATRIGASLDPGKKGIEVEAELNSYAHFQTAFANTFGQRAASAWHDMKVAQTILLASGQGKDVVGTGLGAELGGAAAKAFQTADHNMRVMQTNGTQRPFRDAYLVVVPQSDRPRDYLAPPDGTTMGSDGYYSGLELSRTLDAIVVGPRTLLPAADVSPALYGDAFKRTTADVVIPTLASMATAPLGSPIGATARVYNALFSPFVRNWFGVSIEDSLMPNQSLLNFDREIIELIPKESIPQYGTIGYKVGKELKLYGVAKALPRAPLAYVQKVAEDAASGVSVAKDADRQQIALGKGISWQYRDGTYYAYGAPGALSDGEVSAGVQTAAPQQLFHVVNGQVVPIAIPVKSLEAITQVLNSRSGSFMASMMSKYGNMTDWRAALISGVTAGRIPMDQVDTETRRRRAEQLDRLKQVLQSNQDEFSRSQINNW